MAAREPEELHRLWTERFQRGDVDGLLELYEPEAAFVPQPGQVLTGIAAIREALNGFLATQPRFEMTETRPAIRSGDVALLHSRWTLAGTGPDGNPLNLEGTTADVVRRQADGTWRCVIDNPWGTA